MPEFTKANVFHKPLDRIKLESTRQVSYFDRYTGPCTSACHGTCNLSKLKCPLK